jgi:hypothetical protein
MKRLFFAGMVVAALAGLGRAEERFHVVQGSAPTGSAEAGKAPTPVVIKVDAETGDTWRLMITGGAYWWIPIKNGVIQEKKAEEPAAPAAPAAKGN